MKRTKAHARLLSLVVAVLLLAALLPATLVAAEETQTPGTQQTAPQSEESTPTDDSTPPEQDCGEPDASVGDNGQQSTQPPEGFPSDDDSAIIIHEPGGQETPPTEPEAEQPPAPPAAPAGLRLAAGAVATITNPTAGQLASKIQDHCAQYAISPGDITSLTVTGVLDTDDLDYIWRGDTTGLETSGGALSGLQVMDLSGTVLQGMSSFPFAQFKEFQSLQAVALPTTGLTSVGNYTFGGCTGLTSIDNLPDTLQHIGDRTFMGCTGLTSIDNLPDGLEYIGDTTFADCTNLASIDNLPGTLQYIGNTTFAGCTSLTSIDNLPGTLQYIGNGTFYSCTSLASIDNLPDGLQYIGDSTFRACTSLTSIDSLPAGLTYIDGSAFNGCTGLTSVTNMPAGITTIGTGVFEDCTALEVVDLSGATSLTAIGGMAFARCPSLRRLTLPQTAAAVLAVTGTPTIVNSAFLGCEETLVLVPDALLTSYQQGSIWNDIFEAHGQIKLLGSGTAQHTLTYSATGNGSVAPAHSLYQNNTSVYEGEVVTLAATAGNGSVFAGWQATGATIADPASPTTTFTITGDADISARFALNQTEFTIHLATAGTLQQKIEDIIDSGLYVVEAPEDITGLTITGPLNTADLGYIYKGQGSSEGGIKISGALDGLRVMDLSGAVLQGMDRFPDEQFAGFKTLQTVALPATGLTSVGVSTFYGCTGLRGVDNWPDTLQYIGNNTFFGCTGLTGIDNLPARLEHIGDGTFMGCTGLRGVDNLPDGLQYIGAATFMGCTDLESIACLPAGLQSIGEWVFYGTAITSLNLACIPAMVSVHSRAFAGATSVEVRVPAALLAEYEGDSNWQANQSSYGVTFVSDNTPYSLTLAAAPQTGGSITGAADGGNVYIAQQLTLTATANPGYAFKEWQATGANIADATSATTTFTITGAADITARFALDQTEFTIHLDAAGTLQQEIADIVGSGDYALNGPEDITGLTITGEVNEADLSYIWKGHSTSMGDYGEGALPNLATLNLAGARYTSGEELAQYQFAYHTALETVLLPQNLKSTGSDIFRKCTSLQSVTLPDGLETIGYGAFQVCSVLATINLPYGLETIEGYAFNNCSALASITLPQSLRTIGAGAFQLTNLTEITLPEGVEKLAMYVFSGSAQLASVNLPASLQSIDFRAFGNTAITSLDLARIPAMVSVHSRAFDGTTGVEVRVPAALLAEYEADSNWQANRDNYGVHFTSDTTPYSLTLTAAPQAGGSITGAADGGNVYIAQQLTLTASPAPGYAFKEWQATGANITDAASATTTFTITGNATITAVFMRVYAITTTNPPLGGTLAADKAEAAEGETVTLTLVAQSGYSHTGWQTQPQGLQNAITGSDGTYTFAMPGQDVSITPVFAYTADAETPVFTTQPQGAAYAKGAQAAPLTAVAEVQDGGSLAYQWYSSETDDNTAGELIPGAQQSTYTPATTEVGTLYYYVVATNTITGTTGAETATATSDTAKITVAQPGTDPGDGSGPNTQAITFAGLPTNNTIRVGESFTLAPSVDGQTGSTGWNWDSNFFSATFNSPATFTAVKAGTSTITYTAADGRTASVAITVLAADSVVAPADTSTPEVAATGDRSMMWRYGILLALSAAFTAGLMYVKRRKAKQQ